MSESLETNPNQESKAQSQIISDKFSAAAKKYTQFNQLQRDSASLLLGGIKQDAWLGQHILDIGAGPGTLFPVSHYNALDNNALAQQVVALDIAPGMLKELKLNFPQYFAICGDAESLPLKDSSLDMVYSNLALQWCRRLDQTFSEAHRVMKSGAQLHCAIVIDGSLNQLSNLGLKINDFADHPLIVTAMETCPWKTYSVEVVELTVHFDDLRALLYSIKGVGASITSSHNQTSRRGLTLRGRQDWLSLQKRAEVLRTTRGLPLTYRLAIVRAVKT